MDARNNRMGCRYEILHSLMDARMLDHSWNFSSGAVYVMVLTQRGVIMRLNHDMQRSPKRVWTKTYRYVRGLRLHTFNDHKNWRNWKFKHYD